MALSGTISRDFSNNSSFRLVLEWSAKQDKVGNKSTVNATLYIQSIKSWGVMNDATASPTEIWIDGQKFSKNATSTVGAWGKKALLSASKVVNHNQDGTKSFNIQGNHYVDITWNGSMIGWVKMSKTETLNKIPRASVVTTTPSFTFGSPLTVNISRPVTSYTHTLELYGSRNEGWELIARATNVGTSHTFNFSEKELKVMTDLFSSDRTKIYTKVVCITNGGIGSTEKTGGVVTLPSSTTAEVNDIILDSKYLEPVRIKLKVKQSANQMTHKVVGELGPIKATLEHEDNDPLIYNWDLPESDRDAIMKSIPETNSLKGSVEVTTYIKGVQTGTPIKTTFKGTINNTAPVVLNKDVTIMDTNEEAIAITGDNTVFLQNKSIVTAVMPSHCAEGQKGAYIKSFKVNFDGKLKMYPYDDLPEELLIGPVTAPRTSSIHISVVDSRGLESTVVSTYINVVSYEPPKVSLSVEREYRYRKETHISVSGKFSPIKEVSGSPINKIKTVKVSVYETGTDTLFNSYYLRVSNRSNTFLSEEYVVSLSPDKQWYVTAEVIDTLGSKTTEQASVVKGDPIVFIDNMRQCVGIGTIPTNFKSLTVDGPIITNKSFFTQDSSGLLTELGGVDKWHSLPISASNGKLYYKKEGSMVAIRGRLKLTADEVCTAGNFPVLATLPSYLAPPYTLGLHVGGMALTLDTHLVINERGQLMAYASNNIGASTTFNFTYAV